MRHGSCVQVPGWGIAVAAVGGVLVAALLLGGACWARWRLALRRGLRRIAPPMCGDEVGRGPAGGDTGAAAVQ